MVLSIDNGFVPTLDFLEKARSDKGLLSTFIVTTRSSDP